jgi:hypothetical protein
MAVVTSARTKLYTAATAYTTATDTVVEWDALTWVEVGEVISYSEFGASYDEITHQPISDGLTYKFKGTRNDGSMQLSLGRAPTDAGQALLVTALDSYDSYPFKVALNDDPGGTGSKPTRFFLAGRVMSYTVNPGSTNSVVTASCTIGINGVVLEGAKVVGS